MTEMISKDFWWDNITGPNTLIYAVVNALLNKKTVILKVPSDLPWRNSMRSSVKSAFGEKNSSKDTEVYIVDFKDENPDGLDPGKFILNKYAKRSDAIGYRSSSKDSIQKYIASKNILENKIIWVKGMDGKSSEEWINFCRDFSPKSVKDGLFVIETHEKISGKNSKKVEYIDYSDYISGYDLQIFNSFVLGGSDKYSDIWKKYISVTAAVVCDTDAEVSERLLCSVDFKNESVYEGLKRIAAEDEFKRRGAEDGSSHILSHTRNNNTEEINRRIWASQIQVLFPIIEFERIQLLTKWNRAVANALKSNSISQFGEPLTNPMEAELGTLCYMMKTRASNGDYILYIPDQQDREKIDFLHTCRNLLAHACCCLPEQTLKLLDDYCSTYS